MKLVKFCRCLRRSDTLHTDHQYQCCNAATEVFSNIILPVTFLYDTTPICIINKNHETAKNHLKTWNLSVFRFVTLAGSHIPLIFMRHTGSCTVTKENLTSSRQNYYL